MNINLCFIFSCSIPIQTIFDTTDSDEGGVVALAMTPDARYLATLSAAKTQVRSQALIQRDFYLSKVCI